MIIFERTEVIGWGHAIRGMRNPMNSWEKGDSCFERHEDCEAVKCSQCSLQFDECSVQQIGTNDRNLMMRLAKCGSVHAKYRRMITVYVDIIAPLYWQKEFDTYKVGTVANSCSTMHKIAEKEFTLEDFSCEHLTGWDDGPDFTFIENFSGDFNDDGLYRCTSISVLEHTIAALNYYRNKYLETKDKKFWWQMIQLLPSSYNQKRTVMLNYEVLANIYRYRRNHKLDEWRDFCNWIEQLPYSEIITCTEAGE